MKKIFTILGVVAASYMVNAQNLLFNPGFETALTPWQAGPPITYIDPSITADAHTGTKGAGYAVAAATTGFFQNVPVTAGKTYVISFWYKSSGDSSDTRLWSFFRNSGGVAVYTTTDATTDHFRTDNNYLPDASVWTQYTAEMPAGIGAVGLDVGVRTYTGGTGQFDDFVCADKATMGVNDIQTSKRSLVKFTSVQSNIVFAAKSEIQIVNMNGQIVKSAKVDANSSLDVSALPKGVYMIKGAVNGEQVAQKIIKN